MPDAYTFHRKTEVKHLQISKVVPDFVTDKLRHLNRSQRSLLLSVELTALIKTMHSSFIFMPSFKNLRVKNWQVKCHPLSGLIIMSSNL